MRYFLALYVFAIVAVVSVLGFRGQVSERPPLRIFPDMDEQARYKPQAATGFFADGRQDRPAVPGTVAMVPDHWERYAKYDTFNPDTYLTTGKTDAGDYGTGIPVPITHELLDQGQEKYTIFCSNCHGITGDGNGVTKQYGMVATPSYHTDRIREQPDGMIYETIVHGRNLMGPYGSKLRVEERWAIVAYLRALQRSQQGTVEDVPAQYRKELGL